MCQFGAATLCVPALVAVLYGEDDWRHYLTAAVIALALSVVLGVVKRREPSSDRLGRREGFIAVVLSWLTLIGLGSLPFWLSGAIPSLADAVFESASGYSTTGATILPNIEALSGSSAATGFPDRPCTVTQYAYPDAISALHGLVAVMCAVEHRARTGEGQYVNLSQFETTVASLGHVMLESLASGREPKKLGNRSHWKAPQSCYRCKGEDRWCVIAVADDAEWRRFCDVVERPEWFKDPRYATREGRRQHADALDVEIEHWTGERDAYDVMAAMQAAGIAAGVVQNVADQYERDPQLAARDFFEEVEHLQLGRVTATGIPLGLTATPARTGRSGAVIGQDNEAVFRDLLGLTPEEIRRSQEESHPEED